MKRYKYLLSKVLWASLSIIFVMVLNFFLFRVLPGDPARAGVKDPRLTAEAQNAIRIRFGLDKPVINCFESINPLKLGSCLVNPLETQFFIYVRNLLQGDLGTSYHTNRPVKDMIGEGLVNTIVLIGIGQMIAIFLGMALGLIAAWKANTAIDFATLGFCLVAWSLPTFWLGIVLLFAGSTWLGLPVVGKFTPGGGLATGLPLILDVGKHLILPTLTLSVIMLGRVYAHHAQHFPGDLLGGLHIDGQSQGTADIQHPQGPCAAECHVTNGDDHSVEPRIHRGRCDPDRICFLLAGSGVSDFRGRWQTGLPHAAGILPDDRHSPSFLRTCWLN